MNIQCEASQLLNLVTYLSKISKKSTNSKSLLMRAYDGKIELFASSAEVYGQGMLNGYIVEEGEYLLPLTIIPILASLKDKPIDLHVDLDSIVINTDRNNVELPQIGGSVEDVSIRSSKPEWLGLDIKKIKHIKYAVGPRQHNMDMLWFHGDKIITSDRFRVASYKLDNDLNDNFAIYDNVISLMGNNDMQIAIGDQIWFGTDWLNMSVPTIDTNIANVLDIVANSNLNEYFTVSREILFNNVDLAYKIRTDGNYSIDLSLADDGLIVTSSSDRGLSSSFQKIKERNINEFDVKLNVNYLFDAINNCVNSEVKIGTVNLNGNDIIVINDNEISHYIVQLSKGN